MQVCKSSLLAALVVGGTLVQHASAQCEPRLALEAYRLDVGNGVAVSGDTAFLGREVYQRSAGVWTLASELQTSDGSHLPSYPIAASGDVVVIGYKLDLNSAGSAYVFERSGGVWVETAKLTASDGAAGDYFGYSVSASGDRVLVGAVADDSSQGSAYVFEKIGGVWSEVAKLVASNRGPYDDFGWSVAISGDTAIIGAPEDDDPGASGSAYVFEYSAGRWREMARVKSSDSINSGYFGRSVSLSGDRAVIGADGYLVNNGAAYVFDRIGGSFVEVAKLSSSDIEITDLFGWAVAVDGDIAAVGSYRDDDVGSNSGSVYIFRRIGGAWEQTDKLVAPNAQPSWYFGQAVALNAETLAVTAWATGHKYLFDVGCTCAADFNGDGVVDTRDFVAFLNAWAAGDASADLDGNGVIDTRDFIAYLNLWAAGC